MAFRGCPAGRARCAWGGCLHTFLLLRVGLPLVGDWISVDEGGEPRVVGTSVRHAYRVRKLPSLNVKRAMVRFDGIARVVDGIKVVRELSCGRGVMGASLNLPCKGDYYADDRNEGWR